MSEMIERVARAIYDGEIRPGGGGHILLAYPVMEEKYLVKARAAIEAMREPSETMIIAGQGEAYDHMTSAKAVFVGMIDAALKDD